MTPPLTRRAFLAGLAACASLPSLAAEAPAGSARYLVEILVFRQPGALPPAVVATPLSIVTTIPGRIEVLPETAWQLGGAGAALAHRGGYQLLAHAAWAAIVPTNGRTTARLEDVLPAGTPLAGSVALQRSQYLFLGVEVDYQAAPGTTFGLREKRRIDPVARVAGTRHRRLGLAADRVVGGEHATDPGLDVDERRRVLAREAIHVVDGAGDVGHLAAEDAGRDGGLADHLLGWRRGRGGRGLRPRPAGDRFCGAHGRTGPDRLRGRIGGLASSSSGLATHRCRS